MNESASQTARDMIYHTIRRSIILGSLRSSEQLEIDRLAVQFKTSITPVRDALQMLSSEGLIDIIPRRGYFVAQTSFAQLRDLLELREILEGAAIRQATPRITEKELQELVQVHKGYTGDDESSLERYLDENRAFHYLIAKASGNEELAGMVGHVLDRLARFMVLFGKDEEMEANHVNIVAALRTRDPAQAEGALMDELVLTRQWLIEHILDEHEDQWNIVIPPAKSP